MASTAIKLFIKVLNNTKDPENAALELSLSKIASKAMIDDISKNYLYVLLQKLHFRKSALKSTICCKLKILFEFEVNVSNAKIVCMQRIKKNDFPY